MQNLITACLLVVWLVEMDELIHRGVFARNKSGFQIMVTFLNIYNTKQSFIVYVLITTINQYHGSIGMLIIYRTISEKIIYCC